METQMHIIIDNFCYNVLFSNLQIILLQDYGELNLQYEDRNSIL